VFSCIIYTATCFDIICHHRTVTFDVCVTVHLRYNNINNQLDATLEIY